MGDRDLRLALSGKFRQGGAFVRCCGIGFGTRCALVGEVRAREGRERFHAILLGSEDRRVMFVDGRSFEREGCLLRCLGYVGGAERVWVGDAFLELLARVILQRLAWGIYAS